MLTVEQKKNHKKKTVVDKIVDLENNETQTVADVKKFLAKSFFVSGINYPENATVEIFSPIMPFYRREVLINGIHLDQLALDKYYITAEHKLNTYLYAHLDDREINLLDYEK